MLLQTLLATTPGKNSVNLVNSSPGLNFKLSAEQDFREHTVSGSNCLVTSEAGGANKHDIGRVKGGVQRKIGQVTKDKS